MNFSDLYTQLDKDYTMSEILEICNTYPRCNLKCPFVNRLSSPGQTMRKSCKLFRPYKWLVIPPGWVTPFDKEK